MATFTYQARDVSGGSHTGHVEATTQSEAVRRLKDEGKFVFGLQEIAQRSDAQGQVGRASAVRVRRADILYFVSQMSVMVDSGVPVAEALEGIIRHCGPGPLRRVLGDVLEKVETGDPFSAALACHPRVFSSLFVNLVRAAELSGRLGETLRRVGAHMRTQQELAAKVRGAMLYPCVLALMSLGVVIFLMTFLLPKFMVIYQGREGLLPAPTRIVMSASRWMVSYWPYWSGTIVVLVAGMVVYFKTSSGRKVWHWIMLHLPVTGQMFHKAVLTRSLQTLGTLIQSGVSVLDSVAITRRVAGNHYFEQLWERVNRDLQQGLQLSAPLYGSTLLPRPLTQMIEAGERSGKLGEVMQRIGTWVEEDLKADINVATRLIEPAMIVLIGSMVGFLAIALLLPIFTIARHVSG